MTYADWDTITGTNLAVQNSLLANPLPAGAGDFCRQLGNQDGSAAIMVSSSVSEGAFVGIPITKAIRAEGCIRRNFNSGIWGGGFVVKWSSTAVSGYGIMYDANEQDASLVLNNGTRVPLAHAGDITTTWLSFRMDVFPLSTTGDQIVVSQETSPGSGTYDPISINGGVAADGYFVSSLLPTYAPWGGTSRCGLSSSDARGGSGSTLLDMVRFSVATAP